MLRWSAAVARSAASPAASIFDARCASSITCSTSRKRLQLVELDPERTPGIVGHERADALAGDHQAFGAQSRTASRTTVRLTPVAAIISCSVGSRAPGASLPLVISAVTRVDQFVRQAARRR